MQHREDTAVYVRALLPSSMELVPFVRLQSVDSVATFKRRSIVKRHRNPRRILEVQMTGLESKNEIRLSELSINFIAKCMTRALNCREVCCQTI